MDPLLDLSPSRSVPLPPFLSRSLTAVSFSFSSRAPTWLLRTSALLRLPPSQWLSAATLLLPPLCCLRVRAKDASADFAISPIVSISIPRALQIDHLACVYNYCCDPIINLLDISSYIQRIRERLTRFSLKNLSSLFFPREEYPLLRDITFCVYHRVTLSSVFALTAQGCEWSAVPKGQIDSDFPALVSRKRPAFYAGGKSDFNEFFPERLFTLSQHGFRIRKYIHAPVA